MGHEDRRIQKYIRTVIDYTIGMPPGTYVSDAIMENSMPTAYIIPCEPDFSQGLSLFRLKNVFDQFKSDLEKIGYSIAGKRLTVAFLADNFPSDSFANDYGETFLDKFAQAASSGVSDLMQILGARDLGGAVKQVQNMFGEGVISEGIQTGADYASKIKNQMEQAAKSQGGGNAFKGILSTASAIATGSRVDFPKVWKNSAFSPSYTMTVRLYNPNPGSAESTDKFIVAPLAALLLLALPRAAEDGQTYKWPYLCTVRVPGIYNLDAAYISNITVIKGGDQQNIAWNQSLAMVDIRIDFGSLYDSILVEGTPGSLKDRRPTLSNYLETLGGNSITYADKRRKVEPNYKNHYVYETPSLGKTFESEKDELVAAVSRANEDRKLQKYHSVAPQSKQTSTTFVSRSSSEDKNTADGLKTGLI